MVVNNDYLIVKILRRLSQTKNFLDVRDFHVVNNMISKKSIGDKLERKEYKKVEISLDRYTIEHDIDDYNLLYHIFDKILLELTMNVKTKNFYFIQETIEEDLLDIIANPILQDTNWYITMETHLKFTEMMMNFYTEGEWTKLTIGDKKINTLESSFPKNIIFGTNYPIIINRNEVYQDSKTIKIIFYYIDEFYAIRMITDEKQKKLFLRKRKLKQLKG